MSVFSKIRRGLSSAARAMTVDEYQVRGVKVTCACCGNTEFEQGSAQLNSAAMTFINLDWANRTAHLLVCKRCTHIMWFSSAPRKILE